MALDVTVCFLIAALSGTGVGGGGLLLMYLTLFKGADQFAAQSENLAFFISAAFAALVVYMKRGRIRGTLVVSLSLAGVAGGYLGSSLAASLPSDLLRKLFAVFMIFSSLWAAFAVIKELKDK